VKKWDDEEWVSLTFQVQVRKEGRIEYDEEDIGEYLFHS